MPNVTEPLSCFIDMECKWVHFLYLATAIANYFTDYTILIKKIKRLEGCEKKNCVHLYVKAPISIYSRGKADIIRQLAENESGTMLIIR